METGTVEGDQDPDRRREGFIRSDDNMTPLERILEMLRLAMDSKSESTASTTSRGKKTTRKATKKKLKATGPRERAKPQRDPPKKKPRVTFNTKSTLTKSKAMVRGKNTKAKRPFLQQRKRSKTDLNVAIRKFSASKVKIPKRNTRWARKMADTHIEFIRKYCQEKSKGIFNHFEFTGSFYEHLKAEDANELDILVALDTKDNAHLIVEEVVPGYARIKVTKKSSKYWRFVKDNDGYVRPAKVRSWFFGLVQQAVNQYKSNKKEKDPLLKPSDNGPAAKLLIDDKEEKKKLEVDLVPAFLFKPKKDRSLAVPAEGRHYVAKQLPQRMITKDLKCPREMLWRQSFSLQEKKKMENVDKKDSGCRREVVKVLKTIVKNDSTLAKLSSYHIKTAFLHYNFDKGQEDLEWSAQHLAERLKGLMEYLRHNISERRLSHFFINELDLLMELSGDTLANIEGRLNKLINNESELRRALTVQPENLNNEAKTTKKKSKKKT